MSSISTPNMSLIVPTAGSEPGPTYALDINSSLTIIDGHNHSPGSGVQINPAGININGALPFNGNPATAISYASLSTQSSIAVLNSIYVKLGSEGTPIADLWFNDGAGNAVQLTSGGTVNASIASLPGESFGAGTFTWKQGAGSTTPANMDCGSITLRPNVAATTNGITLAPYAGIASTITLTLPALPAQTNVVTLDAAGNISSVTFDAVGSTMTSIGANALAATMTSIGANAIALIRTRPSSTTVFAGGVAISATCTNFSTSSAVPVLVTNLTVIITTSGRPVFVGLIGDAPSGASNISIGKSGTTSAAPFGDVVIYRDNVTPVVYHEFGLNVTLSASSSSSSSTTHSGGGSPYDPFVTATTTTTGLNYGFTPYFPPSTVNSVDVVAAGTYTYTVKIFTNTASVVQFLNVKLVAYEL